MTTPQRRLRVLIAEDNADTRASLITLVSAWGHDCKAAADGTDALAIAGAYLPDVLLLDVAMPGADGYEVARRVRELPGLAGAYLVACTGLGSVDDVRRAMEEGFDGHLLKPIDPDALRAVLEQRTAANGGNQPAPGSL